MAALNPRPPENSSLHGILTRTDHHYSRRRPSGNIPYFQTNPQMFAALREASSNPQRSLGCRLLIMAPAFAFQYCVVVTSLYSIVNLRLLSVPPDYTSVNLILSAVASIALIVAFHKYIQSTSINRSSLARVLVCFTVYLFSGTLLVLIANADMMIHGDSRKLNATGNATSPFPDQVEVDQADFINASYKLTNDFMNVTEKVTDILANEAHMIPEIVLANASILNNDILISTSSLHSQILAFVGYIIMASSLSSGQFLMSNVAACVAGAEKPSSVSTMEVVVAALGGCCTSFLGALDLSSVWNSNKGRHILIGQIVILLSIGMTLLIGCTVCSLITWYSDVIKKAFQPEDDIEENILIGHDRRPTRTAQEIYDECAALLGRRISISYMEENLSPRNLPTECEESISNSIGQSNIIANDSISYYSIDDIRKVETSITPIVTKSSNETKSFRSVLKTQSFFLTLVLMFLLSSCVVSVEYNATTHLGHVFDSSDSEFEDVYRKGVRHGSAGVFMMYMVSAAVKYFSDDILKKLGWKSASLAVSLISAAVTLSFAISREVAAYFTAACVLGLLRLAVIVLPWTVSARSQMTTSVFWCMMPVSLAVSSAVLSPLVDVGGFHGAAMYYSAACSLQGCVVFLALF